MIDGYDRAGGHEATMRFGPDHGPVVVAAMPLLEEWNRTRAFVVTLLRALATRGIASILPDLPGHGESLAGLEPLPRLAEALRAATLGIARPTIGLGIRSGALLDYRCPHVARWQLAPLTGVDVLADLRRTWLAAHPQRREGADMMAGATIAGTALSAAFLASLAEPVAPPSTRCRVVRLATDPRPADRHVAGAPLWRRAEPGNDAALAELLADDVAAWIAACVA